MKTTCCRFVPSFLNVVQLSIVRSLAFRLDMRGFSVDCKQQSPERLSKYSSHIDVWLPAFPFFALKSSSLFLECTRSWRHVLIQGPTSFNQQIGTGDVLSLGNKLRFQSVHKDIASKILYSVKCHRHVCTRTLPSWEYGHVDFLKGLSHEIETG